MLEVNNELKNFHSALSGKTEAMDSKITEVTSDLDTLKATTTAFISNMNSNYSSENKNSVMNKLSKITDIISEINQSMSSDLKGLVDKSQKIVELVDSMYEEVTTHNTLSSSVSAEKSKENPDYYRIKVLERKISDCTSSFYDNETKAKKYLRELKGDNIAATFVEKYTNNDYLSHLDALQYGSFEYTSYKATNGYTVNYWIYVPDYSGIDVEGIPTHLYLHGSGESGRGVLNCGLPKMIANKEFTPAAMVICPQAPTTHEFYVKEYRDALIEVINTEIQKHNGDSNKISVSGHSMGGICAYRIAEDNPNYFAAVMPISGLEYNYDKLAQSDKTKFLLIHGSRDDRCEYANSVKVEKELKARGITAELFTFDKGHGIQNMTFEQEYDFYGEHINAFDWAIKQDITEPTVL